MNAQWNRPTDAVGPTRFPDGTTTLPIWRVRRDIYTDEMAADVARKLFGSGLAPPQMLSNDIRRWSATIDTEPLVTVDLDMNLRTGDIWQQSRSVLPPDLSALTCIGEVVGLPHWKELPDFIGQLTGRAASDPSLGILVGPAWQAKTHAAVWRNGVRSDYDLNVVRSYSIVLNLPIGAVPVVGSGAKLSATYDGNGRRVGFHTSWAPVISKLFEATIIPQVESDRSFRASFADDARVVFSSTLAYRVLEAGENAYLAPCWRYDASYSVDGTRYRTGYMMPASTFDERVATTCPAVPSHGRCANNAVDWGATVSPRSLVAFMDGPCSAAAVSGALGQLGSANWATRTFANVQAFESDWVSGFSDGAGKAELAIYVGHANGSGWAMSPPDRAKVTVARARFGDRGAALKWVIVDACGPLQDGVTGDAFSSVFDRWNSSFAGLRALLGFGTTQTPSDKQLASALSWGVAGDPIAASWFRAAQTHQPNTCSEGIPWVAGMFGVSGTGSALYDQLAQYNLPNVGNADGYLAIWVPIG